MRLLAFALAATAVPLAAQAPANWKWNTDAPAAWVAAAEKPTDSLLAFVRMPPGWHLTMGPGGVLYEPRYFADGSYSLESQIFHFPNSGPAEYGLMVGGRDLDGPAARYVVFAARPDGSVAAWERAGGRDRMLADWRPAPAVHTGDDVIGNVFKLTVTSKEAVFKANGLDALILPLDGVGLGGQYGFRVGRGVNLHAATLTLTQRLAPARGD